MKKLRSKKGLTLVELLLATLLLAVLSAIAFTSTSLVFGTGSDMKLIAKAEVLGSEVLNVIKTEMRFCEDLQAPDGADITELSFTSVSYGLNTKIGVENGKMYFTSDGLNGAKHFPIGNAVYDEVSIGSITFAKNETDGVDVTVKVTDGTKDVYTSSISVSMLNFNG